MDADDPACAFRQSELYTKSRDRIAAMAEWAGDGGIVFLGSFGHMYQMWEVAAARPAVSFVHFTGFVLHLPNVANLFAKFYQARFLAGALMGKELLATYGRGAHKVAYVGSYPIPEIKRHINAFALGLQTECPECRVLSPFLLTWFNPVKPVTITTLPYTHTHARRGPHTYMLTEGWDGDYNPAVLYLYLANLIREEFLSLILCSDDAPSPPCHSLVFLRMSKPSTEREALNL